MSAEPCCWYVQITNAKLVMELPNVDSACVLQRVIKGPRPQRNVFFMLTLLLFIVVFLIKMQSPIGRIVLHAGSSQYQTLHGAKAIQIFTVFPPFY